MARKVVMLVLTLWLSACSDDVRVQALGTIERNRIALLATSSEIIRALPVKEGSQVSAGDVLVRLDDTSQQAILAQAQANLARAQATLAKLVNGERPEDIAMAQATVERSRAQLTEAERAYRREADLLKQKLISQAEVDIALAARDSARADFKVSQQAFTKLTAGARIEEIEQAQAELSAAEANVALQQQKLRELTIVATQDGLLDSLPYHLGERVPLNATLAIVLAGDAPYARVYVPEPHRVHLLPGKTVQVHVDGISQPFTGQVRWVSSEASFTPYYALTENERARLMYLAEIDLPPAAAELPSGIPAQVDLP
ncbi:HlyD family secretion protein [Vibrio sp.]|uniref:HlyD family secretion protein n=1 Tax=Vibrio sp. TaxID=678 RepID=UPI003D12F5C5